MRTPIYLRRGNKADLPALLPGEPGFATDTKELFIGASGGNVELASILSGGFKIQSGQTTINCAVANTQYSTTVTFPKAFAGVPFIAISFNVGGGLSGIVNVTRGSVLTDNFTLYAYSYVAQNITIDWIAIGS